MTIAQISWGAYGTHQFYVSFHPPHRSRGMGSCFAFFPFLPPFFLSLFLFPSWLQWFIFLNQAESDQKPRLKKESYSGSIITMCHLEPLASVAGSPWAQRAQTEPWGDPSACQLSLHAGHRYWMPLGARAQLLLFLIRYPGVFGKARDTSSRPEQFCGNTMPVPYGTLYFPPAT